MYAKPVHATENNPYPACPLPPSGAIFLFQHPARLFRTCVCLASLVNPVHHPRGMADGGASPTSAAADESWYEAVLRERDDVCFVFFFSLEKVYFSSGGPRPRGEDKGSTLLNQVEGHSVHTQGSTIHCND
uniref:(northern house mosquito) hypothetical protein n=1 Tax=Culex pipiens TaxID=7175 RepID=A0A8D8IHQ9_CULPI